MAPPHKKRSFWRTLGVYFRRFRIALWALLLLLLSTLVYLNQVGLPDVIKQPVLEKLRARGLDLQFSRIRLRWYHGVVAENVRFGQADEPFSPQLAVAEVQLLFNHQALRHFQLQVDSLVLRDGRLVWPIVESTNKPTRELSVEHIQSQLRFLPDDQWALDDFEASFGGAHFLLSGVITNASAVRDWNFMHSETPEPRSVEMWQNRIRRLADTLQRIHFSAPPELRLDISGDARDLLTFNILTIVSAADAHTPWGTVSQGRFSARLFSASTNAPVHAEISLEAAYAQTEWTTISNLSFEVRLASSNEEPKLVHGDLKLSADRATTKWAAGSNLIATAQWIHSITNPVPLSATGRVACAEAQCRWGTASQVELSGTLAHVSEDDLAACDESWTWWTNLQPYLIDWQLQAGRLSSTDFYAGPISCSGTWRPPELVVSQLETALYDGRVSVQAGLDVATRQARASVASTLDPHRVAPLFPEEWRRLLKDFSWTHAPELKADVALVLPAWTNREPDWRAEVQPTLFLAGQLGLDGHVAYRDVAFSSASSHFIYSNLAWHVPDLKLVRPEGTLSAEHRASDVTKDFYWRLSSTIDPGVLRPLLSADQQRAFNLLSLSAPPILDAEIWGRSHEPERIGFEARAELTNFVFREQTFSSLQARVQYTNKMLQVIQPRIQRGKEDMRADGLAADFNTEFVYLTNAYSTGEPMVIARAIGPKIGRAIEAYRFLQPPAAHVYGVIPMHGEDGADLHFHLDGGPFEWWKFHVPHIIGDVHWAGKYLTLTNVYLDFYGGKAAGSAGFDFTPEAGTDFQLSLAITNTLLHGLTSDLSGTNHLEGWLSGVLVVTKANTEGWNTVFGFGDALMRDGTLWDMPVFGIFSPVLNGISPGMGNSRASAGTCKYTITNGIIRSEDLDIRSTGMRLKYRGTVDLESRVNARVEAELLKDMWLVGPLVSTMFWPVTKMFEYKVTGTLDEPKMEPLFLLPKLMMVPLHPFRTLKSLFPEEQRGVPETSPPK